MTVQNNMSFMMKSVGLALVYLAAAKIGLAFGTVSNSVTMFWPAGGIALAALMLWGVRYLPVVFAAAYLAGVMVDAPIIFALGSSIGNTLETGIGYFLLKRLGNVDLSLNRPRDLFLIIALGGLIPAVASAALGSATLLVGGMITPDLLPGIMWRWWRADVLGITFFTPLILVFVKVRPYFRDAARGWETLALWVISFVVGQVVLLGWAPLGILRSHPLSLAWVFPLLAWAGLRTGRRNTALVQLLLLAQSLASAYLHVGFFADDFHRYGLANFWIFAMLLAVAGMALAIQSTAQRYAMKQSALHSKVFTVGNDGVMIVDADNTIVSVNPAFTDITGYPAAEVIGRDPRLLASGKQSREFYADMWKSLLELGHWEGELWNRRKDGAAYLERLSIHTLKDARGNVINRIGIFSDITESKATQEVIAHQAQHDFLTNLPNRLLFRDRFSQQLAWANRHETKFAVIFLDLDQFKPVNDTLGHQMGDQLLVAVADRLKALVREIDTVSRFGGDEFAILVSEVNERQDVITLADKILASLNQPFILNGYTICVSGSLGIALYPDHGSDMDAIISAADAAMYQAKNKGNNYVIATAG